MWDESPNKNSRNPPSVGDICEKLRPSLLNYAVKRLRRIDDAEDAVGRTICTALLKAPNEPPRGPGKIVAWVYGILKHTCMQDARSWVRSERLASDQITGCAVHGMDALASEYTKGAEWVSPALAHEARYRLRIASLADIEMRALANRINGMSRRQNAKALGLTEEGVHSALQRAVKKLRAVPFQSIEGMPEERGAEEIFADCSKVPVYRAPTSTGAQLARYRSLLYSAQDDGD